jgi:hypothetical protein
VQILVTTLRTNTILREETEQWKEFEKETLMKKGIHKDKQG